MGSLKNRREILIPSQFLKEQMLNIWVFTTVRSKEPMYKNHFPCHVIDPRTVQWDNSSLSSLSANHISLSS